MATNQTIRSVWILARPLSYAQWLPLKSQTSDGVFPLCHWGVLITELCDQVLVRALARSDGVPPQYFLGDLFELNRLGDLSSVNMTQMVYSWTFVSAQYVGQTSMTNPQIWAEDMYLHYKI
jgi:hypothetical protein